MDKKNMRNESIRQDRSEILKEAEQYRHRLKMVNQSAFGVDQDRIPVGMSVKFVRAMINGQVDTENLRKHAEAHWVPAPPERYPEFKGQDHLEATNPFKKNVFLSGLILMERPIEFTEAELSVYREKTAAAMNACPIMDEYRDPRMPVFVGENSYRTPNNGQGSFGFSD